MTSPEKIIDRINKLMSKTEANGCTPEEAAAAAAMVQKLIAKHHIDMRDAGQEDDIVGCVEDYKKTWQTTLANVIAKNTRCHVIITGTRDTSKMAFIGHETDLQAVLAMYDKLEAICAAGIRAAKRNLKGQSSPARIETSYSVGFVSAVSAAMGEQCRALQLVTPEDVHAKIAELFPRIKQQRGRTVTINRNAYDQGSADGRDATARRQLA